MAGVMKKKTIVGYADRFSVAPGETVSVKVSEEGAAESYSATIVRLTCTDTHALGPGIVECPIEASCNGSYPARRQPIHAGSYAVVEDLPLGPSFTLQAFVWPTLLHGRWQTVMGRATDTGPDILLGLDEAGAVTLRLGSALVSTGRPLQVRQWAEIVAACDNGKVTLRQTPLSSESGSDTSAVAEAEVSVDLPAAGGRFTIAAHGPAADAMAGHFNGKIDRPRVAARALSPDEAAALAGAEVPAALASGVTAAWDFARDMAGDRITDVSGHGRHGRTVNAPGRAMTGHNWAADIFDWRRAPEQYGAIHFHDDDIFDAGWQTDISWVVPEGTSSGVYAAKLDDGGIADHVVFWVRPRRGTATSDVCFLASTATYLAYGNYRVMECSATYEAFQGALLVAGPEDVFLAEHPEYGGSLYESHTDGSGVALSSRLRPLVSMRPGTPVWQFAGDGYLTWWLDHLGIEVDVVTDEDLHHEGAELLAPYRVVLTGNHPEYWSTPMWDGLQRWLDDGGRLMYLGGNGFYWRIGMSDGLPGAIEVRRAEDGCRPWEAQPGEYHLASTGELSGLWRRVGRTPNSLVGVGMAAQGFDRGTYYVRRPGGGDPRAAWIFDGVRDERIGDFGYAGNGASGQEIDRHDLALGSPQHALVLASSEGHNDNMLLVSEDYRSTHLMLGGTENDKVRSDLVFFETESGGAVFSTGSISWISSLPWNGGANNVSRITRNVLERFRNPTPFAMPKG